MVRNRIIWTACLLASITWSCLAHPLVQDTQSSESSVDSNTTLLALFLLLYEEPFSVESALVGGTPNAIYCSADAIYIAGYDDNTSGQHEWRLEKRSRYTGQLDTNFGSNGVVTVDASPSGHDELNDITYDGAYLYLAGWDDVQGHPQWRIEKRLASNGALDSAFGSGGIIQYEPVSGQTNYLHAIELAAGGIYLGGSSYQGPFQQWQLEKRNLTNGALDTGFNGTGIVTANAGNGTQSRVFAMTVDDTYIYAGGAHQPGGNLAWRLDKRFLSDGSLESTFATGTIIDDAGPGAEQITSVSFDDSFVYVSGSEPDGEIEFHKYNRITGIPDASVGTSGHFTTNPDPSGPDGLNQMIPYNGLLYLIGHDHANLTDLQWRISLRNASDASLVTTFGQNGILQIDPTTSDDRAITGCIMGQYIFIAGSTGTSPTTWRLDKRRLSDGSL